MPCYLTWLRDHNTPGPLQTPGCRMVPGATQGPSPLPRPLAFPCSHFFALACPLTLHRAQVQGWQDTRTRPSILSTPHTGGADPGWLPGATGPSDGRACALRVGPSLGRCAPLGHLLRLPPHHAAAVPLGTDFVSLGRGTLREPIPKCSQHTKASARRLVAFQVPGLPACVCPGDET